MYGLKEADIKAKRSFSKIWIWAI